MGKRDGLKGNLIPASVPDFKQDYKRLIDYLVTQIKKVGVTVEFGKEATPELIKAIKPQVVFMATGATPAIPEIPGIGKENVMTASNLLLGKKGIGKSVVIIGGGLLGFETVLYLKQKGKRIKIVEILENVMRHVFSTSRMYLLKEFNNSEILTNIKVLEVMDEGISIEDKYGKRNILEADTVVISSGFQSNKGLYESLKGVCEEIYAIGDCIEPRKVIDAIWEGFRIARLI